jgi:di/tripeptidase
MGNALEIFESIAKDIPRCSKNASKMKLFIEEYAKKEGYEVKTDSFGYLCNRHKHIADNRKITTK